MNQAFYPVFLSIIIECHNQEDDILEKVAPVGSFIKDLVQDYEIIVIDNGSNDQTFEKLRQHMDQASMANVQVYKLTKKVDYDTACWAGVENALGDFACVYNPWRDDLKFMPKMLEAASQNTEVVFAYNQISPKKTIGYRFISSVFNFLYQRFNGLNLNKDAPMYRLISRSVINYILQYRQPAMTFRYMPATGGFKRKTLNYSYATLEVQKKNINDSIDRGLRLLVSTTRMPMRLATYLCLFGAAINVLYSAYVVLSALLRTDIAPGWVSMSMQQSGMFFLFSLVLFVLSEYLLFISSLSNQGPLFHISEELTSKIITRKEKLNIENK